MSPPRRTTGAQPARPLDRDDITPIGGVQVLDASMLQRSPADVAAMVAVPDAGASAPLWARLLSVPAMVLLMSGLLVAYHQTTTAREREVRAEARQDRAEFRAAVDRLTTAVERNTEKTATALEELRRELRDRGASTSRGKER